MIFIFVLTCILVFNICYILAEGKNGGERGGNEFLLLTIPGDGTIPEGKNRRFFEPPRPCFPSSEGGLIQPHRRQSSEFLPYQLLFHACATTLRTCKKVYTVQGMRLRSLKCMPAPSQYHWSLHRKIAYAKANESRYEIVFKCSPKNAKARLSNVRFILFDNYF